MSWPDSAAGRSDPREAAVPGGTAGPGVPADRAAVADPGDPVPGGTSAVPKTGHAHVDAVLDALSGVDTLPPGQQVARYGEAHRALHGVLRTVDET